ncbi:MAG: bifunctional phosphopantothenoylcysteine decarboxylase/phosphopantothenate--cysteine ligase CoaBC, partial [Pontibacterium sp.]
MQQLTNRRILLGITGGIAAYKSAELTRALKTAGADVRVVMTPAATEFITPLTLQALSGNPVHQFMLDAEAEAGMGHIELAKWADLILVAPATADFIARLATGHGDDLLTTLCLATEAPLCIAPAMNQAMWKDKATQNNIAVIKSRGIETFGPASGEQACGDIGLGRMEEPHELALMTAKQFASRELDGKHVVITAGPTREAIDPVRYISNHSSGKMGFALAQAAVDAGAQVTLIAGPVNLPTPERVNRINVQSAEDMLAASLDANNTADIFIASAAVADYRPANVAEQKMKKGSDDEMALTLVKNPDIVATIANSQNRPITIGFAAETQNVLDYARGKLIRKNLDMIIANDVSRTDIGFNSDENHVTVVTADNET